MTIDYEWLEEHLLLCKLTGGDRDALNRLIEPAGYGKGEVIVREGEAGGHLYVIRSGSAEISCRSEGRDVHVADVQEDFMFGEISFLTGNAVNATVTASEESIIYKLSRGAYSELMLHNQDLVYALFAHMLVQAGNTISRMNREHVALQKYLTGRGAEQGA